jgi:hypothetical protein
MFGTSEIALFETAREINQILGTYFGLATPRRPSQCEIRSELFSQVTQRPHLQRRNLMSATLSTRCGSKTCVRSRNSLLRFSSLSHFMASTSQLEVMPGGALNAGHDSKGAVTTLRLICDRCHDIEAVVLAIMEVLPLEETRALCGVCVSELPAGFLPICPRVRGDRWSVWWSSSNSATLLAREHTHVSPMNPWSANVFEPKPWASST